MRCLRRNFDNPPDYVAYPKTEEQLFELLQFCSSEKIAVIPYGGGSSVVGGVEPPSDLTAQYKGCITVDMKNFDKIKKIDKDSLCVLVQVGNILLEQIQYCQNFMFSKILFI